MELKAQFNEFLAAIRPTEKQKEDWRTGAVTLRSRLASDPELGSLVVATFLQGSIRRATAVRPSGDRRPDADVVVVTKLDHTRTTPQKALDKFVPFLDRHYPGKWRPQGRSFGIELSYVDLDLVVTALPPDDAGSDFMARLYRSEAVSTPLTLEEAEDWRLNEKWHPARLGVLANSLGEFELADEPPQKWQPHPLLLPDRDVNMWGRTHPIAQIRWTAAKNRRCNGHYVNLVRAVKWWRHNCKDRLPKYPKGYPLEHMVGTILPDGASSVAHGFVQVMEGIRDTWAGHAQLRIVPTLPDHGVPEHDVLKRLDVEHFVAFHGAVSEAASAARKALENEDAQESAELWRGLLGSRFPLPGPQGGDRPRSGFTPPIKPAAPAVGRFA